MSSVKKRFYSDLRDEFLNDDFTASFLYRYLAAEKDAGISRKKPTVPSKEIPRRADPYVLLQSCFMALERGELREEDYLKTALRVLIKNPKLRIRKELRTILWELGREAGGADVFDGARQDSQRYEILLRVLEKEPCHPGGELLAALHADLLKRALEVDARAFLYDAGFPATSREKNKAVTPRKRDRLLDMLDAYCEEKQFSLQKQTTGRSAFSGELSSEEKLHCEALFKILSRSGNGDALIPIRIDPYTGTGLYIVGANYLRETPRNVRRGVCGYVVFYPNDLNIENGRIEFSCVPDEEEPYLLCPHLEEALAWYQNELRQGRAYEYFHDVNGALPAECPEEFRIYFGRPAVKADLRERKRLLAQEGRAAFEEDEQIRGDAGHSRAVPRRP